ncbi:hypothetical protein ACJMK2_007444, partial [Sinanodonta woodiana]
MHKNIVSVFEFLDLVEGEGASNSSGTGTGGTGSGSTGGGGGGGSGALRLANTSGAWITLL